MPLETSNTLPGGLLEAARKSAALFRNSGALTVATVVTACLGFCYWWLAARLFPPEAIGRAAALLSVMGLLGLLGDAGLGTLLVGELCRYPRKVRGLVGAAAVVAIGLAVLLALVFVLAAPLFGHAALIEGWLRGFLFVFGCGLTAVTMIGNQAFLGTLNGTARMIQQVLFSALKLGMIGMAVAAGAADDTAILLTWVTGLLVSWIGVDLATRGSAHRLLGRPDFGLLQKLRRKVIDHYALDAAVQAPGLVVPYLVLMLFTPTINAAFAAVWMLITTAAMIPAVLATVLFPVVRASPKQSRYNFIVSLGASLLFSAACSVLVLVFSRHILALFNPAYPDIAGTSLRFLGFSLLGSTLKFHACTLARLSDGMRRASLLFMLGGLMELCFAVAGAKLGGLERLVVGWSSAVSIEGVCILYATYVGYSRWASRPTDPDPDPTPRSVLDVPRAQEAAARPTEPSRAFRRPSRHSNGRNRQMTTSQISIPHARTAPRYRHPGGSTAFGTNLAYRLGKLKDLGLLKGVWLDCGCADGGYTEALVAWGADKAIGVDPDPSRIALAQARRQAAMESGEDAAQKTEYHCCTDDFPLPCWSVDTALMNEVLEHVADEGATLREIRRVLRPGGRLVVISPNRWFPFEGHGMRFMGHDFGFPIPLLPWLPYSLATKVMAARNYWPHELRDTVAAAGFEIEKVDYVLPVFDLYKWMPSFAISAYRRLMPAIERTPLRRFGVSTLIVARRPA